MTTNTYVANDNEFEKARKKPYGHKQYSRKTRTGKIAQVPAKGVKPAKPLGDLQLHGFDKAGFRTVENFNNILKKYGLTKHQVFAWKGDKGKPMIEMGTTDVWSTQDGRLKLITSGNPRLKEGYSHYIGIEAHGATQEADALFKDIKEIDDYEAAEFGESGYIGVPRHESYVEVTDQMPDEATGVESEEESESFQIKGNLTVKGLVDILKKLPQDTKVMLSSDEEGNSFGRIFLIQSEETPDKEKVITLYPANPEYGLMDFEEPKQ